jgi:hypothetical protein
MICGLYLQLARLGEENLSDPLSLQLLCCVIPHHLGMLNLQHFKLQLHHACFRNTPAAEHVEMSPLKFVQHQLVLARPDTTPPSILNQLADWQILQ